MKTYVLRYKDKCVIGDYGVTFNKRSLFVFRTSSVCTGYSIRRTSWKQVIGDHNEISELLTQKIKKEYEQEIMKRVLKEKKRMIEKWSQRSDYNGILQVVSTNNLAMPEVENKEK